MPMLGRQTIAKAIILISRFFTIRFSFSEKTAREIHRADKSLGTMKPTYRRRLGKNTTLHRTQDLRMGGLGPKI
jgi:hypothetical protein